MDRGCVCSATAHRCDYRRICGVGATAEEIGVKGTRLACFLKCKGYFSINSINYDENYFFDEPILNSPYQYPSRHWELDADRQPTQKIIESRHR